MPPEFLPTLRVHPQRLDQSRERVPESVPADFLVDAGASRRRLDVVSHDGRKPQRLHSCHLRRSPNPIGRGRVSALLSPRDEGLHNVLIHDTGLREASVLHLPIAWSTTERTMLILRPMKSRLCHCRPISSLRRIPVRASQTIMARSRSASSPNSRCSSSTSRITGIRSRLLDCRTAVMGFLSAISYRI